MKETAADLLLTLREHVRALQQENAHLFGAAKTARQDNRDPRAQEKIDNFEKTRKVLRAVSWATQICEQEAQRAQAHRKDAGRAGGEARAEAAGEKPRSERVARYLGRKVATVVEFLASPCACLTGRCAHATLGPQLLGDPKAREHMAQALQLAEGEGVATSGADKLVPAEAAPLGYVASPSASGLGGAVETPPPLPAVAEHVADTPGTGDKPPRRQRRPRAAPAAAVKCDGCGQIGQGDLTPAGTRHVLPAAEEGGDQRTCGTFQAEGGADA